jgi:hydrogenase expression/formation protein HypC
MCLAIPMQVLEIHGFEARCVAKGIERTVSLFMLQHEPVAPGDHVLIHVGHAIQKLRPEEARRRWEALDEILAAEGDPELRDA